MPLFGRSKLKLADVQKRSAGITNIFVQTRMDAEALSEDITGVVSEKISEIKALEDEVLKLEAVKSTQDTLASKIEAFLGS